jgi:hypothetical protein
MLMTFHPTISQLDTISELTVARMPMERIAAGVGVSVGELRDWRTRCINAAASKAAKWAPPPRPTVSAQNADVCRGTTV